MGRLILRIAIIGLILAALSALYQFTFHVNTTTAALSYLLVILCAATLWGLPEAMIASVASVLLLDYYFLPPVPSFGIDDPQNWVAWGAFLTTSFVVSQLSTQLKQRAREANERRREIERLYALSCRLMQAASAAELAMSVPSQIAEIFGCKEVGFFDSGTQRLHSWESAAALPSENQTLVPVQLGAVKIGSLAFRDASISATGMQAIANLVASAMDRAQKRETAAHAEGARRHQELKSMLLDALAHEFQTPLTSIRAGIHAMLAESPGSDQHEWLEIMNEESERLSAMMAETMQMARIEAGHVDLDKQMHTVEDLVQPALKKEMAAGSPIVIILPPDLPAISADAALIRMVIRQLTDNALKYSQAGAPITVRAQAGAGGVTISVADHGPGIPVEDQGRIFEKYYRGKQGRGHLTGMGLGLPIAREVVEAHDGFIWVESQPGAGATFSFTLPFAHEEASV